MKQPKKRKRSATDPRRQDKFHSETARIRERAQHEAARARRLDAWRKLQVLSLKVLAVIQDPLVDLEGRLERDESLLLVEKQACIGAVQDWCKHVEASTEQFADGKSPALSVVEANSGTLAEKLEALLTLDMKMAVTSWFAPDRAYVEADAAFLALIELPRVDLTGRIKRDRSLPRTLKKASIGAVHAWREQIKVAESVEAETPVALAHSPASDRDMGTCSDGVEKPLALRERQVLDLLFDLPNAEGLTGGEILSKINGLSQSDLTSRVIPGLRRNGWDVPNQPRSGYYLTARDRARFSKMRGR